MPHNTHRRRRKPLEPFFSRAGVTRLEPMLGDLAQKLVGRFEALKGSHAVVRLDHVFVAFSGDVIRRLCCEEQNDFLDDPNFASDWYVPYEFPLVRLFYNYGSGSIFFTPLSDRFLCSWGYPRSSSISPFIIKHECVSQRLKWTVTVSRIISLIPESVLSWFNPRVQNIVNFKKVASTPSSEALAKKFRLLGSTFSKPETINRPLWSTEQVLGVAFRSSAISLIAICQSPNCQSIGLRRKLRSCLGPVRSAPREHSISFPTMFLQILKYALGSRKSLGESWPTFPRRFRRSSNWKSSHTCRQWSKKAFGKSNRCPLAVLRLLSRADCTRFDSLSYGVMHNLPHCSPDVPIQYKQWTIPVGVCSAPTSLCVSANAHRSPF